MADEQQIDQVPDFRQMGRDLGLGMDDTGAALRNFGYLQSVLQNLMIWFLGWILKICAYVGAFVAETIAKSEDQAQPGFQRIAEVAIKDMFGVDVGGTLNTARGRGGNQAAADAIGDMLLRAFAGQARGAGGSGELQPSDAPAKSFLSAMAQLSLEGWLEGWIVEACSFGQIETFGDLDDTISHVLGLGRASAAVHGPLVRHMIVTPLEWKILKEHRPTLLSDSLVVREYLSGHYTSEEMREELARAGYSDKRIEALLRAQFRYLSLDDAIALARHGTIDRGLVLSLLREQGYDQATAEYALVAAETKRLDAVNDNALASLTRAYVNNDLNDSQFSTFLPAIIYDDNERDAFIQAARLQRDVNVRHMTQGEVIDCVELEILSTVDYRRWLEREGYPLEESTALELRLKVRMQKERDVERARRELAEERAAEKQAKLDAAAARQLEIDRQRELARRGPLSELSRAAAHGRIPFARVEEVLRTHYDDDTVQIVLENIEEQRQAYLEQQQKAEDAKKRGLVRHVDVGELEQAVISNTITLDQFRRRLPELGFSDGDADLITATLRVRKADYDDAKAKRLAAAAAATRKSIDLDRFEQLVRRGVRSFAAYDALLKSLDFDDAARAAMAELLRLKIADDDKARKAREQTRKEDPAKGLTLEQFRRGVMLKLASIDDFDRFLSTENYAPQAHALLVAELRDDVATADAARLARSQADTGPVPRALPLLTVRRAARLGIITPTDYAARLVDAGYSDDDIAIEMELLLAEVADVQAARAEQTTTDAVMPLVGLTLAQMSAAVRAGVKHLEDYRALAVSKGLSPDAVTTLVRVLADELASSDAARIRRTELASELQPRDINLATLEQAVRDGTLTLSAFAGTLTAAGLDTVDVNLLVALLSDETFAAGG